MKNYYFLCSLTTCIFLSTLCISGKSQNLASQCKVFLDKPIFTTKTIDTTQESRNKFRLLQCSANWRSASEAQSAGIEATIPIYNLPIPFSASWDNQKVEQWKSSNCSDLERSSQANLRYYEAVYSVDPVSAKAGLDCFDKGFKAEVDLAANSALRCTLTETPAAYVFEARWRRTVGEVGEAPKVINFTSLNTSCPGAQSLSLNQLISEGGSPVLCLVEEKAAAFSLVTSRGGCSASATVRLPKIKLPALLILSEPMFLSGQDLEIPANTKITTNGYPFSIRADRISLLGPVHIQSFDVGSPSLMTPGKSAGPITISANEVGGQGGLVVLNAGQPGGAGDVGPKGAPGQPGRPGTGRTSNWRKNCPIPGLCDLVPSGCEGGSDGSVGGQGAQGYPGLTGMPGGAAGEVRIDVPMDARKLFSVLTNVELSGQTAECRNLVCGGNGGDGGPGGPGGDGGQGGEGAPGTVYCGGTNSGATGAVGPAGPSGLRGPRGVSSAVFQ